MEFIICNKCRYVNTVSIREAGYDDEDSLVVILSGICRLFELLLAFFVLGVGIGCYMAVILIVVQPSALWTKMKISEILSDAF